MIPVFYFIEIELRILLCVFLFFVKKEGKKQKRGYYRSSVHTDAKDINMIVAMMKCICISGLSLKRSRKL